MIHWFMLAALTAGIAGAHAQDAPMEQSQRLWSHSPHGKIPELDTEKIVALLECYARAEKR